MKSYISNVMNAKTILRFGFLIAGIFILSLQDAKATHIVGGDLTYRCLGGNTYQLRLTVRRDCLLGAIDAQFDSLASIGIYDLMTGNLITNIIGYPDGELLIPFNGSDTLNEFIHSDCSVVSGDVCVHTTVYVMNIILPYRPTGYTLAYQRCCRNSSLNNVLDPLNTGMTLSAELTGMAQQECNSSPQFGAYPPIYLCVNKELVYDHSAIDLEGDSLVYSLCTPYAGATKGQPKPQPPSEPPYDLINWRAPYSLANLLGGVPLTINPQTGLLTGTPNTIGQFVVGICVTAYRNGVVTATTRRDFQFNVRMCRDVPVPNFAVPALDCEDLTVTFDNQTLLADEYLWIFNFGDTPQITSPLFEPTFTYPGPGFYTVALVTNVLEGGVKFCTDTIYQEIGVFDSQINADFSYDVSSCTEEGGIVLNVTDLTTGFEPEFPACTYEWLLIVTYDDSSLVIPSTVQNPTFNFNIEGEATALLTYIVTSCNGCSATQSKSFPLNEISLNFNPNSDSICFGESTHLLIGNPDNFTYTWDPTLGLDLTNPWDPIAHPGVSVVYCATVTDGLCVVTGCTPVIVQQLPTLAFGFETDCKSLAVQFDNNSIDGDLFHWDFGTGDPDDTTLVENPTFIFPDSGVYVVTLSSRDGCDVSTNQQVTANAISEDLGEDRTNCFDFTVELNPDNNPGYDYIWSTGDTSANPIVTVTNDETFYVTISSPKLPGCEIVDSITILVPTLFDVNAGSDVTSCALSKITLTSSINTNAIVTYEWTDCETGQVLGSGPTLVVQPEETSCYIVTATDSLGCFKSDTVIVNRPPPTFIVNIVDPQDTSYCNIQTITLNASSIPGITFEWFNCDNELIGEGPTVDVTPGTPTCFFVIGTDPLGCQDSAKVNLTPTFFDLDISGDQDICIEETAQVSVTDNNGQNLTYFWYPGESIIGSVINPVATVDPASTTEYCVRVTNTTVGCIDTLCTTVVVNLFEPLIVTITPDPVPPIVLTESVQLTVNQPPNFTYMWSSTGGDPVENIFNPVVTPPANNITYTVTVTNLEGCTQVASITIAVDDPFCDEREIFLPKAFTPNNDNVNDVLFVRGNFIETLDLHIYNRWGQQVFQTNDQNIGWNGSFDGERLSPDVFGYYLEVGCPNGKSFFMKGNVTLLE